MKRRKYMIKNIEVAGRAGHIGAIFLLMLSLCSSAAVVAESVYVPPDLLPWQEWVVDKNHQSRCPFLYNRADRSCIWVSSSDLNASATGMDFRLRVRAFVPAWLDLPGNDRYWPSTVNGARAGKQTALPVRLFNGRPQIKLAAGETLVSGRLSWARMPASVPLPNNSGLVSLRIHGEAVPRTEVDRAGNLWLRKPQAQAQEVVKNALTVQVFRLLQDENPAKLITRVILEVSGEPREIKMGQFLLDGFVPLYLNSALPARIDDDKGLRVQVKSGRWEIDMGARYQGQLSELFFKRSGDMWPSSEFWSFDARRALRVVEISGAALIDPSQTNLPAQWRSLPAYQLEPEQVLSITTLQRGDPLPEADSVTLRRDLFLDFNGEAYTAVDTIEAKLKRSWRLDMQPQYQLGSVRAGPLNGVQQAQLITRSADGESLGVELRTDKAQLLAVSRIARQGGMPAAGWRADLKQLDTQLHLPVGWSLLAASGVDKAVGSWLDRWTLWDIFLVLIIVVATFRLHGVYAASLAAVALLLIYQRANAPVFIWLNMLVVLGLINFTSGKIKRGLSIYLALSFAVLLLIIVPFSVDQLGRAVYPQLAGSFSMAQGSEIQRKASLADQAPAFDGAELIKSSAQRSYPVAEKMAPRTASPKQYADTNMDFDPKAVVQTGPGIPAWRWSSVNLRWNGPVSESETLHLYLVPPWVNRIGNVLAVLSCILFAGLLAMRSRHLVAFKLDHPRLRDSSAAGLGAMLLAAVTLASLGSDPVQAQVAIDPSILSDLEQRLTRDPECLPECVAVQKASLAVAGNRVVLSMTMDAQASLAAPLPVRRGAWEASSVSVNGKPAVLGYRDSGQLFVYLDKGSHRIVVTGDVVKNDVELNFDLPLHNFSSELEGWEISGVRDAYVATGSVQLRRIQRQVSNENVLLPDPVPAFVTVNRHIELGLDWKVATTVTRIAPARGAISLDIPLLENEAPLSDFAREGNALRVTFAADQNRVSWQSNLPVSDTLVLTSPEHSRWAEVWTLSVSPLWHVSFSGISSLKQDSAALHTPMWMPWPGERLEIGVARPPSGQGESLTVDSVNYQMKLGQRIRELDLSLALRTSRGQKYAIELPQGAVLDAMLINGRAQPLIKTSGLIDIALPPGDQTVALKWHQDLGAEVVSTLPQLDLGANVSNVSMSLTLPRDRWPLAVGGPLQGPVVLFWGVVLVVIIGAFLLSYSDLTPLKFYHWLFLGLGVCSTNLLVSLVIIAWLFAVGARGKYGHILARKHFNIVQILLLLLSLVALLSLFSAISMGLLSSPDMHIGGNGSHAFSYRWYQDRLQDLTPNAWVVSVPIFYYRVVMLAWSLWLSVVLLNWLKWEWQQLNEGGFWQKAAQSPEAPKEETKPKI